MSIEEKIHQNTERKSRLFPHYNPLNGEGSLTERDELNFRYNGADVHLRIPVDMMRLDVIQELNGNDVDHLLTQSGLSINQRNRDFMLEEISSIRLNFDFEFFAATACKIQAKEGKAVIPFILNAAQRKLVAELERLRLSGTPIRIVLLKARQWGGSTLVQIYMAWIQTRLLENWHSVVVALTDDQSRNIRGMYSRLLKYYPPELGTLSFSPFEGSTKTRIIKERGCIIGVGSVQHPDNLRSFDFSMAHLSEVGLWKTTAQRSAEDLAQAVANTVPFSPNTLIVKESTAKGVGNYFHREWQAAESGKSGYSPVFVPWFEIERYVMPVKNPVEFIKSWSDYENWLWEQGATIEGINWYRNYKLSESYDDWRMKSEFPTTSIESFQSTGQRVFHPLYVSNARKSCEQPAMVGDLFGKSIMGKDSLKDIEFAPNDRGNLKVWIEPDKTVNIRDRYALFADVGGRTKDADYSTIKIIDRYWMMYGDKPVVCAVWHGHCFHPETNIYTSRGFVNIKDVKIGDMVWTHKNRFRKVTRIYKRDYDGQLLNLKSHGNYETVKCTPEHPFLTSDINISVKKRRKYYKGIKCFSYSKTEKIGNIDWVEADKLKYTTFLTTKDSRPSSPIVINKYNGGKSKDSNMYISDMESLFSILGYYLAEGHIGKRKEDGNPDRVVFSFGYHEKDTVVKDCSDRLKKIGLSPRIKESKNVGVCRVIVYNTNFSKLISSLCGELSWGKMINPWVLSHSKKLLSVLLNSLWLGDGSSYKTDNTVANTITTVSPILARQIRDILILLGNRPSIYNVVAKTKPKNFKSIRPRYNIVWTVSKMKKYTQLQNCNSIAYKVKSKSYENYNGFVYNLEVEDDNSYSTENYIVHNCDQDTFAWKCAQVATWYNNGLLAIEVNSMRSKNDNTEGDHSFTVLDEIADVYTNLYARTSPDSVKQGAPTKYGFHTNKSTKPMIIDTLNGALRDDLYEEKDLAACDEMDSFEYKPDGSMGAVEGQKDDRVITTAGCVWLALKYMPTPEEIKQTTKKSRGIVSEASF